MTRKWLSLALFCVFCLAVGFVGAQSNPVGQSPIAHGISGGAGGGGDVSGPSSCTDNAIATFDGTDGKTLQCGGVLFDTAAGTMTQTGGINFTFTPNGGQDLNGSGNGWIFNAKFRFKSGDAFGISTSTINWSSTSNTFGTPDIGLKRNVAGVLGVTNGTAGGTGGAVDLGDPGTRPTCDSTYRGTIWIDEGGAGVADDISICAKNSSDAYAWYAAATVP